MDFKERLQKITVRNMKKPHQKWHTWPMEKRIEVVSQHMVLGNMRQVAAITGVGYELVREWKQQPWWKELEAEIRQTQNIEMDTKLSKIVDKSLDAVLDRVENGDVFYDQKSGELKRKPVALRDIHRVASDTISKRELLRGNATERRETTQVSVAEQLKLLAAEFAKMTGKPQRAMIETDVIDVTPKEEEEDAFSEEWEEGLQEGTGVGTQEETESGEGEGCEERSPEGDDS